MFLKLTLTDVRITSFWNKKSVVLSVQLAEVSMGGAVYKGLTTPLFGVDFSVNSVPGMHSFEVIFVS